MERARRFERPTLTLARLCSTPELRPRCHRRTGLERARRFERPTLTLARLCSTPELRPRCQSGMGGFSVCRGRVQEENLGGGLDFVPPSDVTENEKSFLLLSVL